MRIAKRLAAWCAAISLLTPALVAAAPPAVAQTTSPGQQTASQRRDALIAALRKHVKYVFVFYQENRSFDSYFGTFPGADGIYSRPPSQTLGFTQQIENLDGTFSPIVPFLIGPKEYASDTDDVDHSHPRLVAKIDVTQAGPQMDKFALVEEQKHIAAGASTPTLAAKQYGELAMAHEDCDTVPLLWNYANRFALFDHVFSSELGPSTPGNIAIISAQEGETQAALHPAERYTGTGATSAGVPVVNDRDPAWGPFNPSDGATAASVQINLTSATLPLTLAGRTASSLPATDAGASRDFADITDDVKALKGSDADPVPWGWFQEGYDQEPSEPSAAVSLTSYVTHHNGPQYFGYVANSAERSNLHGLGDLGAAITNGTLPAQGGVFYAKGGFQNFLGLKPADPDAAVQKNFNGDDDHPGYSDAQISEALVASGVNAVAHSKYWAQSAIIVTWDDSEGDYDHIAPPLRSIGPGVGNLPQDFLSDGPRVPLLIISPFSKTHQVVHSYGDLGSVVKFVDTIFNRTPLAGLPDEERGLAAGESMGELSYGPDDGPTSAVTDLVDGLDPERLLGHVPPLPRSYAEVNPRYFGTLSQTTHLGCAQIGVIPVDRLRGVRNQIPADFNPRPATDPTRSTAAAIDTRAIIMKERDPDD